jgi:hypothetical protein
MRSKSRFNRIITNVGWTWLALAMLGQISLAIAGKNSPLWVQLTNALFIFTVAADHVGIMIQNRLALRRVRRGVREWLVYDAKDNKTIVIGPDGKITYE